jgi:hypothetical protein
MIEGGTPRWLARPVAFLLTIVLLPLAVLLRPRFRRQMKETRLAIEALNAHVSEVWQREGPERSVEIIRSVFRLLDEQKKVFGSVEVKPFGRFDGSGCVAVLDWLYAVERDCGNWDEVIALTDRVLDHLAPGRRPAPYATEHVRTWVVRKAGALDAMGKPQAAKELLFSHIDIVKGDSEAERMLDRT